MDKQLVQLSKLLSLVLRHQPGYAGVQLDENGYAPVNTLIDKLSHKTPGFDMEMLEYIVEHNNKKRFAFNPDKTLIRASQGHSIAVDLGLEPAIPPDILFHGTGRQFLSAILASGLDKRKRQ